MSGNVSAGLHEGPGLLCEAVQRYRARMRLAYSQRRRVAWVAAAVLIAVHVWAPHREGIVGGVLPWDLAFHLGWMLAAGLLIEAISRVAWRDVDGGGDG